MNQNSTQHQTDKDQLKLLGIFHYVLAGLSALFSCFFLFHVFIGWNMVFNQGFFGTRGDGPPGEFGWLFIFAGLIAMFVGWSYSALLFAAGKSIAKRKNRTLVLIASAINCCNMPLGLLLGVFTFVVMFRPSVKDLFETSLVTQAPAASLPAVDAIALSIADAEEAMWRELEKKAQEEQKANEHEASMQAQSTAGDAPQVIDLKQPELQSRKENS